MMISLNDYLYSGDTVLKILKKYARDLEISAEEMELIKQETEKFAGKIEEILNKEEAVR